MKLGRNELCYCGSGKKYKKCCLKNDNESNDSQHQEKESESEMYFKFLLEIKNNFVKDKEHIKKYRKIRLLHSEVLNSMVAYYEEGKYDLNKKLQRATKSIKEELNGNLQEFNYMFDPEDKNELKIFYDTIIYKNHKDIECITEEYLNKKKFRNEEKVKMLNSMKNSYVGLFQVINSDPYESYVELEDIFTKRRFKIIDIALSISPIADKGYFYNRIITYDNISFGSGLNISFFKNDKNIKEFIKNYDKNSSDFINILNLYELHKKSGVLTIINNIK